ncbi:MAG TPA: hypothetical protein VFH61_03645 [Thermoleophilia bacterium]|nr:hypothetical protein [Thermoleophilia bacterium]
MDLTTALVTAISAETAALVALFWLYVKQRDRDEKKYHSFTETMLPLLTNLSNIATEMNTLVRGLIVGRGANP